MAFSFFKGIFRKPPEEIGIPLLEETDPRVASLREERALLARRLQRLKNQFEDIQKEVSGMSDKPLAQQRREAKKAIIDTKRRKRKISDALGTEKLKFVVPRYVSLTGDDASGRLLKDFVQDPLANSHRLGLEGALADLLEKIEETLVPTRQEDREPIIRLLKKLDSSKLKELAEIEQEFARETEKNRSILSSENPLKRASTRQRAIAQEIRNVENELALVSERLQKEIS